MQCARCYTHLISFRAYGNELHHSYRCSDKFTKKFVGQGRDPDSRTRRDESCRMILNMTCYDEIGPNRYSRQVRIYTCAPAHSLPSARVSS